MIRTARIIALSLILLPSRSLSRPQDNNAVKTGCAPPTSDNLEDKEFDVSFDFVEFSAQSEVPPDIQEKLVEMVKDRFAHSRSITDLDWLGFVKEITTLALQDQGYFKAVVDATAGLVRAEPHGLHYWISLDAKPGPKYVLGEVRFSNETEFPDTILRKEIDLQSEDVFNVSKIRDGVERIRRLYAKHGYIDMTSEPEFKIEDNANRIDINFRIEESGQYRIRSVEVRGLDKSGEDLVLSKVEPGQIFDPTVLDDLSEAHPGLPRIDSLYILRDTANHNISLVIGPVPCDDVAESAHTTAQ